MPLPPGFTIDQTSQPPAADKLPPGFTIDKQERSLSSVPMEALSNVVPSAVQFGKDLAQPFMHPIDTARDLKNLGLGVLEKAGIKSSAGHEKHAEAVGKYLVDRYGGWENVKKTMATDPVGFMADASMVLTGGGGIAARAPGAIGKAGEIAGAAGRVVDPVGAAIRVAKPTISGAQGALRDSGVAMTPGQMMGGVGKRVEDAASSIPILGDFINSGRERSIESFNHAVANQALEPIGESLAKGTAAGHETVTEVGNKLGKAYDTLLPQLHFQPDWQLRNEYQAILQRDVAILPQAQQQQFAAIINSRVSPFMASNAGMTGQQFKNLESQIGHIADQYRAGSPADRGMADALDSVQKAAREALERSNPAHVGELQKINLGYAMFARMRDAAVRRATSAGVFTPSDLLQGIKKSATQGTYARGEGLMQTFAEAGQKVLPSTVPDSGTARRLMTAGGLTAAATHYGHPLALAPAAAVAAAYTKPGMKAVNAYMDPRTRAHRAIRHPAVPVAAQGAFQSGRGADVAEGKRRPLQVDVTWPLAPGGGSALAQEQGP